MRAVVPLLYAVRCMGLTIAVTWEPASTDRGASTDGGGFGRVKLKPCGNRDRFKRVVVVVIRCEWSNFLYI